MTEPLASNVKSVDTPSFKVNVTPVMMYNRPPPFTAKLVSVYIYGNRLRNQVI
ncbi:MAG: hypothetical protein IPL16_07545 [Ignavibacteria bacterium]|nr:hypothetical protein [Ignavibacteria bacterium]